MIYAIGLESVYFNGQRTVRSRPDSGLRKIADESTVKRALYAALGSGAKVMRQAIEREAPEGESGELKKSIKQRLIVKRDFCAAYIGPAGAGA